MNCDVALNVKGGRMGFGIIMLDQEGKVLVARSVSKLGSLEPTAAETMAIFYGHSFCHERGIQ